MKGAPRHYIRRLVSRLTALGYIYDDGYLSTAPRAKEVLSGGVRVTIRGNKPETSGKASKAKKRAEASGHTVPETLFAKLKELRLDIAREEKVPAFVVFSDATLVDMCVKRPRSEEEMLSVSGVGQVKMERYGRRFFRLLSEETPNQPATRQTP